MYILDGLWIVGIVSFLDGLIGSLGALFNNCDQKLSVVEAAEYFAFNV